MANTSKPISLHPLKLKDAVSALLKVKPQPKEPEAEKPKKSFQKMDK
jgi:hypothetical protein